MNHKIRVGLIGGNFERTVHLPAFSLDKRVEVLGMVGSTPDRSIQFASEYNLPKTYCTWEDLVNDKEIDVVSVAVPPYLQPKIALAALNNGKAVFAEKPLGGSLEETSQLQEIASLKEIPNMVNFHLTALNSWIRVKDIIGNGELGKLQNIIIQYSGSPISPTLNNHWRFLKGSGTGTLFDFVSHYFHALEWFAGPIAGLNAKLFSTRDNSNTDAFDVLAIKFISGASAAIIVNRTSFLNSGYRIEFSFSEGSLLLENKTRDVFGFNLFMATKEAPQLELMGGFTSTGNRKYSDGRIYTTNTLITRLLDWLESGEPATPSFKEALNTQRLLEAAYISDKECKWIAT